MAFTPKTIGILGGGHLSRMTALAAARLGVRVCILTPEVDSPAAQVVPFTFVGDYTNHALLKEFAACVDVITYESDDIPPESIRYLQKFKPVYPDDRVLGITQNRLRQKQFFDQIGIPAARWAAINRAHDIPKAMEDLQIEKAVLKGTTPGGPPRMEFAKAQDSKTAWRTMNTHEFLLEEKIDFACEISTIIARDPLGQTALYSPALNERDYDERGHDTLKKTTTPAPIPEQIAKKADGLTQFMAEALDVIGVLCVDFFVTRDGRLLVNRISPHPDDSGLWTTEGCLSSQFEQQIRTICSLQVGSPRRHSDAVMHTVQQSESPGLAKYMEMPNAAVHLYGRTPSDPAQRIGHVTMVGPVPVEKILGLGGPGDDENTLHLTTAQTGRLQ